MEFNVPASSAAGAAATAAPAAVGGAAAAVGSAVAKPAFAYALLDGLVDASKLASDRSRESTDGIDPAAWLLDAKQLSARYDARRMTCRWIEMDLGRPMKVLGVETQGIELPRLASGFWVKAYRVDVSDDGVVWEPVGAFEGNYDVGTRVRNRFPSKPTARFVRLIPKEAHSEHYVSLRWDVLVTK